MELRYDGIDDADVEKVKEAASVLRGMDRKLALATVLTYAIEAANSSEEDALTICVALATIVSSIKQHYEYINTTAEEAGASVH